MNFGEKIKLLRANNKESQQTLAEVLSVSFQSVSKWENSQSYPEITMLKKIAEHYNVSVDYLLDDNNAMDIANEEDNKFRLKVAINRVSSFQVWTDFEYNGTSAPKAVLDGSRRRTGAKRLNSPSDDAKLFTIAVDDCGKIVYAGKKSGWGFASPCDQYYAKSSLINSRMDCFILQPTYMRYEGQVRESWYHCNDYEFVIPKNGFVMVFNPNDYNYRKAFDAILQKALFERDLMYEYTKNKIEPQDFMTYNIMDSELDCVTIELVEDDTICITYPKVEKQKAIPKEISFDMIKEYIDREISRRLDQMDVEAIPSIHAAIEEMQDDITDDMEDELEDIRDEMGTFKEQLDNELKQEMKEVKKQLEKMFGKDN